MHQKTKSIAGAGALVAAVVAAHPAAAQVPFQITRPVNGATVRETVRVQIPRSALRGNNVKYLALTVDGKFRAGVAVPEEGKPVRSETVEANAQIVSILWNTKAPVADPKNPAILYGVEDGTHTLRVIAYNANDRKVAEETLTLTINNRLNLALPPGGVDLSYRFQVGDENRFRQRTELEYIGERRNDVNDALNLASSNSAYRSRGAGMGGAGFAGGMGGMMGPGGPGGLSGMGGAAMMGAPGGMAGLMGPGGPGGARGLGGGRGRGGLMGAGGAGGAAMMGAPGGMMGGMAGMRGAPGGMMGGMAGMMGGQAGMMGGMAGFAGRNFGAVPQGDGPFTIPVQIVRATFDRTTEDRVGPTSFFIRDRVKDGTIISGNGASARLENIYLFKSRYRTVLNSGKVVETAVASVEHPGAYIALPLIDLGGGRRRVGDTWITQAPLVLEWATLDPPPLVRATNTLQTLEWQDGYQTVRIQQTFNGRASVPIFGGAGKIENARVDMKRTIWFAYKARKVIRTETITEVEGEAPGNVLSAMVPQAGVGGLAGGMGGMMGPGGPGGLSGMGGAAMMGGPGGIMGAGRTGMGFGGGRGGNDDELPGLGGAAFGGGAFGGAGGGFGAMQQGQQLEAPKVPAKFRSVTTVTLAPPQNASRTARR